MRIYVRSSIEGDWHRSCWCGECGLLCWIALLASRISARIPSRWTVSNISKNLMALLSSLGIMVIGFEDNDSSPLKLALNDTLGPVAGDFRLAQFEPLCGESQNNDGWKEKVTGARSRIAAVVFLLPADVISIWFFSLQLVMLTSSWCLGIAFTTHRSLKPRAPNAI